MCLLFVYFTMISFICMWDMSWYMLLHGDNEVSLRGKQHRYTNVRTIKWKPVKLVFSPDEPQCPLLCGPVLNHLFFYGKNAIWLHIFIYVKSYTNISKYHYHLRNLTCKSHGHNMNILMCADFYVASLLSWYIQLLITNNTLFFSCT